MNVVEHPQDSRPRPSAELFAELWESRRHGRDEDAAATGLLSPYAGLRSFSTLLNAYFFGRTMQKRELNSSFTKQEGTARRIIFVVGGSGSGKSSLVRAGLVAELPAMQTQVRPEAGAEADARSLESGAAAIPPAELWSGPWYVAEFRPGNDPVARLGAALRQVWRQPEGTDDRVVPIVPGGNAGVDIRELFDFVDRTLDEFDARDCVGEQSGPPRLLLHIEQFEEIFRPECDSDGRNAIMQMLREIDELRPERLFVIATMRSEELHRLSEFPGIASIVNRSVYLIDLVEGGDVRDAIVSPAFQMARLWGLPTVPGRIEPNVPFRGKAVALLEQAYAQTGERTEHTADRLPLLQHALMLLWEIAVGDWLKRRQAADEKRRAAPESEQAAKVARTIPDPLFWIGPEHVQQLPGWKDNKSGRPLADATEDLIASPLGRCLARMADQAFDEAVTRLRKRALRWTAPVDLVERPAALQSCRVWPQRRQREPRQDPDTFAGYEERVLQAALCAMGQLDDQGRAVRRIVSIDDVIAISGAGDLIEPTAEARQALRDGLDEAFGVFERATLVDRLPAADAGRGGSDGDHFTVTHESLIRCWDRLRLWLRSKRELRWLLWELGQKERNKAREPERTRWLDRKLLDPEGERASNLIPRKDRVALAIVFGRAPVFSRSWTAEAVLSDAEEVDDAAAQRGTAGCHRTAEDVRRLWVAAKRFERTGHWRQYAFVRTALASVVLLVIAISACTWGFMQYDQARWSRDQLKLVLVANEALAGGPNGLRTVDYDIELAFAIGALEKETNNAPAGSDEQEILRRAMGQMDDGIRQTFGDSTVVTQVIDLDIKTKSTAFCLVSTDKQPVWLVEDEGKLTLARSEPEPGFLRQRSVWNTATNETSNTFVCLSDEGTWMLTWLVPRNWEQAPHQPSLFRILGQDTQQWRVDVAREVLSQESLSLLNKLHGSKTLRAIARRLECIVAQNGRIGFESKEEGDASFFLPTGDPAENTASCPQASPQASAALEIWTRLGLKDAQSAVPAMGFWDHVPAMDSSHCRNVENTYQCEFALSQTGWRDKQLFVSQALDAAGKAACPAQGCETQIEIRYKVDPQANPQADPPQGGAGAASVNAQGIRRVQIRHTDTPAQRVTLHGDFIWLQDVRGRTWRYAVGQDWMTTMLEERVRRSSTPEGGQGGGRPPPVCDQVPDCRNAFAKTGVRLP